MSHMCRNFQPCNQNIVLCMDVNDQFPKNDNNTKTTTIYDCIGSGMLCQINQNLGQI